MQMFKLLANSENEVFSFLPTWGNRDFVDPDGYDDLKKYGLLLQNPFSPHIPLDTIELVENGLDQLLCFPKIGRVRKHHDPSSQGRSRLISRDDIDFGTDPEPCIRVPAEGTLSRTPSFVGGFGSVMDLALQPSTGDPLLTPAGTVLKRGPNITAREVLIQNGVAKKCPLVPFVRHSGYCQADNHVFLEIDKICGKNLHWILTHLHQLDQKTEFYFLSLIIRDLSLIFSALEKAGVVHCDVKLENLVFGNLNGKVGLFLVDFGGATLSGETVFVAGTSGWMSPELVLAAICNRRDGYETPEFDRERIETFLDQHQVAAADEISILPSSDWFSVGLLLRFIVHRRPIRHVSSKNPLDTYFNDFAAVKKINKLGFPPYPDIQHLINALLDQNPENRPHPDTWATGVFCRSYDITENVREALFLKVLEMDPSLSLAT